MFGREFLMPQARPSPSWLSAPQPARQAPVIARKAASNKARQSFRRECVSEFRIERALMFLLAVLAVVGIGYGFSCLVDLVQHWAVFNAGVGQLVQ